MKTHYATQAEAEADGWQARPPSTWTTRDTSGRNSYGYEFTATSPDGKRHAKTQHITINSVKNRLGNPGAVCNYYRSSDFK